MAGKFITFEGPERSGRTSVLKEIAARLTQKGTVEYLLTREPGGNRIAEKIRGIILDKQLGEMDARTEALLYAAARRQHLVETVLPALKADKLVLCDRYVDSSIVYQGAGRGLGEAAVAHMNEFATNGLLPELTLYFDVSPEIGLKRIARFRSNEVNRLDKESLTFHETVHAAYLRMAKAEKRIVTIDASQPFKNVVSAALQQLNKALPGLFD